MKLLIAPKGVSTNVINSQLMPIFNSIEGDKHLICHSSHRNCMSEEASNITFYKSLFSLSLFISKIKPEKVYCRDVYSFLCFIYYKTN